MKILFLHKEEICLLWVVWKDDPMAWYRCEVRGHLAHDCPSTSGPSMSGGSSGPTRGSPSKSGKSGPKRGRGPRRHFRFGGPNVLYDSEGQQYPVDDCGQIYVPLEAEQTSAEETFEEEKVKETKN